MNKNLPVWFHPILAVVKLHCCKCQERLGDFNHAINHQKDKHDSENFMSEHINKMFYFVDDCSVYTDDIELEDDSSETLGALAALANS